MLYPLSYGGGACGAGGQPGGLAAQDRGSRLDRSGVEMPALTGVARLPVVIEVRWRAGAAFAKCGGRRYVFLGAIGLL